MDFISYLIIAIGIGLSAWVAVRQKPWWKLTKEEKKKRIPIVVAGSVLVVLGIVSMIWQLSAQENKIIGGEKDEHGWLFLVRAEKQVSANLGRSLLCKR
jgi:uncharacterized membrane protein